MSGRSTTSTLTIVVCFIVAVLEGFDIQAAGVAAPGLARALGLSPDQLGMFFGASTLGMLVGAYLGGWSSDRIGRKPVLMLAVGTFAVGSLATGVAESLASLSLSRLLTGVGLGAALPALIALVAEHNAGRSGRAVALMYAGTPVGGAVVGVASAMLSDWRHIFYLGGALPAVIVPLLYFLIQETYATAPGARSSGSLRRLWGEQRGSATGLLWLAFFSGMLVLYLMLNWTPMLLAAKGFANEQIAIFQTVVNLAGGAAVMAAAAPLDGPYFRSIAIGAFAVTVCALVALAEIPPQTGPAAIVAFLCGSGLLVSQSILYATAARIYPPEIRGTGVGAAVAAGRIGSVSGPVLGGIVLQLGFAPGQLIYLTIPVILFAAVTLAAVITREISASR